MLSASAFAALLALCAPVQPPAQPTPADSRPCVTAYEYAQIQVGDSAPRVRRIWDGLGELDPIGSRVYPYCDGGSAVIDYYGLPSLVVLKHRLPSDVDPFAASA